MPEPLPLWLVRLLNPAMPQGIVAADAAPPSAPAAVAASWAAAYPDVPRPAPRMNMALFAARWTCGDLHGEDAPAAACELLHAGFDSPGLHRLARAAGVTSSADAAELIDQVLMEFAIPLPFPARHARLIVTRHIAQEVIAGLYDPWQACTKLDILWGWTPDDDDVRALHGCMEKGVWDPEHQGFRRTGVCDVIATFARLGKRTDEEIFA